MSSHSVTTQPTFTTSPFILQSTPVNDLLLTSAFGYTPYFPGQNLLSAHLQQLWAHRSLGAPFLGMAAASFYGDPSSYQSNDDLGAPSFYGNPSNYQANDNLTNFNTSTTRSLDPHHQPHGGPLTATMWQPPLHNAQDRLLEDQQRLRQMHSDWNLPGFRKLAGDTIPWERSTWWAKGTISSLKGGMMRVMESGEYSDLKIICDNRRFSVHKVVVCSQSKVLAAAMKKGFKESELNTIDLSDNGILLVSNLMKFLYTGNYPATIDTMPFEGSEDFYFALTSRDTVDYDDLLKDRFSHKNVPAPTGNKTNPPKAPIYAKPSPDYDLHVEMYALADQYDIPALGTLAKAKFDTTCIANWHPKSFLQIIPRVYESTLESNQGLRALVLDHARKHSDDFVKDEKNKASFHALTNKIPEFGWGLLNGYMSARPASPERYKVCSGCGLPPPGPGRPGLRACGKCALLY